MKKLLLYAFSSLMFFNISFADVLLSDPNLIESKYLCKFESVEGSNSYTSEATIYISKELGDQNFLVSDWENEDYMTDDDWFNLFRLAKLKDGKDDWGYSKYLEWVYADNHLLTFQTFYSDKNEQWFFKTEVYELFHRYQKKLKKIQSKADKEKRSKLNGKKHLELESKYFQTASEIQNTNAKFLHRTFYRCSKSN